MTEELAERPGVQMSFRWVVLVALALAGLAFVGGRYIYQRYAGYRPLALMHVPQTMRYRARVELGDPERAPILKPLLTALDPNGRRRAAFEHDLGVPLEAHAREVAFGVGPDPFDFVLVLGLQLQAGTGLTPAQSLCRALADDEIRPESTGEGCRFGDGSIVAQTPDGGVLLASKRELVQGLLGQPEIGDRLGFSGPSVRGVKPDPAELSREVGGLARLLAPKYP